MKKDITKKTDTKTPEEPRKSEGQIIVEYLDGYFEKNGNPLTEDNYTRIKAICHTKYLKQY